MTSRLAWASFAALALTQIAIPLTDDDATIEWLSSLVVVAFFLTALAVVVDRWGAARAFGAAAFVVVATLGVERLGTSTGFPFGEYDYTGALQPTVAGVPVIVPLAWFAMGIPALEVGHAIRARFSTRRWTGSGRSARRESVVAVLVGAGALTAWDLFLDPQMVEARYWTWAVDGAYEGIPLSNYAGWLGTGVVVLAVVDRIRPDGRADVPLLALYTWWTVMSTIGCLVFFGRPLVGVVGGVGMGTFAALAWRRRG